MLCLPERWNHLSPSGGGQRGQQLLVFTEHEHISEAGVGQCSASSADAEQVITQDHRSSHRHSGALRESLIYAGERRGGGVQWEAVGSGCKTRNARGTHTVLTCSSDISNDVKSVLVNGSSQREGDDGPTVHLVKHGEHQAPQVCHGGAMQLYKSPLLAVIGPIATGHLTDDHTLWSWRGAGAAVLPQRRGCSHLWRKVRFIPCFTDYF